MCVDTNLIFFKLCMQGKSDNSLCEIIVHNIMYFSIVRAYIFSSLLLCLFVFILREWGGGGDHISFLNYHLHMHVARIWAGLICDNYCTNLKLNHHIQCGL